MTVADALAELQHTSGSQCCPSCVSALGKLVSGGALNELLAENAPSAAA